MAFRPDPLATVPLGLRACRGWPRPQSISEGCHSLDIPYLQRYTCCSEGMTYRTEAVSGGSCGKPWSVLESESSYRRRRVKKGSEHDPHTGHSIVCLQASCAAFAYICGGLWPCNKAGAASGSPRLVNVFGQAGSWWLKLNVALSPTEKARRHCPSNPKLQAHRHHHHQPECTCSELCQWTSVT